MRKLTSETPNELYPELLGILSMNPYKQHNSASREQMLGSHLGQCLTIAGATERFIQTGMEREYGKYTFSVQMPYDGTILRIIERYPKTYGADSIEFNPQTIAIYERADTKEIGMIDLPRYCSNHSYFGFPYKSKQSYHKLKPGNQIKAGETFLDSPSITEHGGYKFGKELNVVYMSHPAVAEDGIMISRDVLPSLAFKTYETRSIEWGARRYAINAYGDDKHYKPFPDIGDYVRPDGVLMALREYDPLLSVVEQDYRSLQEFEPFFDKAIYVPNNTRGRVVDIRIHHEPSIPVVTPDGMDEQPLRYDRARRAFYQSIVDEWRHHHQKRGASLRMTPELHRQVVEALAVVGRNTTAPGESIRLLHRNAPLDIWRIEIVVEYEIIPTIGFKLTGCHGDKGVICKIAEPHEMPVDQDGNRADIVMDGTSTMSRMILGRMYEQYTNACRLEVRKKLQRMFGLQSDSHPNLKELLKISQDSPAVVEEAWNYLMGFYKIVSPKMYEWMISNSYSGTREEHLQSILSKNIYLYIPPNNSPESTDVVLQLEEYVRPTWGPVTYVGDSGRRVTTKRNFRIGSVYVMLLEKIGDDWTAVSSGKWQHFGVLSQVTSADKYSQPFRNQAIRALGEAEVRIYASYVGAEITADILDRNNNPFTHKYIVENILSAPKPTAIESIIDRNQIPIGGSRPLQLVRHIAECAGWRFTYTPSM